jgi:hypothetical protein
MDYDPDLPLGRNQTWPRTMTLTYPGSQSNLTTDYDPDLLWVAANLTTDNDPELPWVAVKLDHGL